MYVPSLSGIVAYSYRLAVLGETDRRSEDFEGAKVTDYFPLAETSGCSPFLTR